ncbi:MAG: thioredoxin family protein [Candidatus Thorarchaeota archaeon]|jgi:thioredoxin-like negative regulator of GroEL
MSEENQGKGGFEALSKRLEDAIEKKVDEPLANGTLNEISDSNFMEELRKPSTAVIEFYTSTCPYCIQLAPILDELASEYKSKVYFAKINIDNVEGAADAFDVVGVPLVIAFKKGQVVAKMEGLRRIDEIDGWVESIHKGLRPMNLESGPVTKITLSDLS